MGMKVLERGWRAQPEERNAKAVECSVMMNCVILFAVQKIVGL